LLLLLSGFRHRLFDANGSGSGAKLYPAASSLLGTARAQPVQQGSMARVKIDEGDYLKTARMVFN